MDVSKVTRKGKAVKLLKVAMFGYAHIKLPNQKLYVDHMKTQKTCLKAFKEDQLVYGVKYPTRLHELKYFNLVDCVTIDDMRGVMSGVVKMMLKIWFSSVHKKEKFKVSLSPSKKNCVSCFNESPLKVMRNTFCFTLKDVFVLEIFEFLFGHFGHVGKLARLAR